MIKKHTIKIRFRWIPDGESSRVYVCRDDLMLWIYDAMNNSAFYPGIVLSPSQIINLLKTIEDMEIKEDE